MTDIKCQCSGRTIINSQKNPPIVNVPLVRDLEYKNSSVSFKVLDVRSALIIENNRKYLVPNKYYNRLYYRDIYQKT